MNRPERQTKLTAHRALADGDAAIGGSAKDEEFISGRSGLTHREIRSIYLGLVLSMSLSALNQTIVATALPTIGRAFGDVENLPWIVTAYLLTATIVSPLYGKLSDIHGRRAVMLTAIGIFIAGSVASAAAPNMGMLIVGRALQGLGGGGLIPMVQTTIADMVSPRERGRYQGYTAGIWVVAGTLGPVLGGFMAEHLHWSVIFWMNVPLGLIAALMTHKQLKKLPRHDRYHKLDMFGAVLLMGSAVAMLLALSWGGTRFPWLSLPTASLIAASGLLALAFGWRLTHADEPFLPISLLRNPVMCVGTAANSCAYGTHLALTVFMPIYYVLVHGLSATQAGLALVPAVVLTTPGSVSAGQVMMRARRYKWFGAIGLACSMCVVGALTVYPQMPLAFAIAMMGLFAFGVGCLFPIATVAVQNSVPHHQVGTATGTINLFRQLTASLVIAIMGAILLAGLGVSATRGVEAPSLSAAAAVSGPPAQIFHWVFATAEVFLCVAFVTWLMLDERPLAGPGEDPPIAPVD